MPQRSWRKVGCCRFEAQRWWMPNPASPTAETEGAQTRTPSAATASAGSSRTGIRGKASPPLVETTTGRAGSGTARLGACRDRRACAGAGTTRTPERLLRAPGGWRRVVPKALGARVAGDREEECEALKKASKTPPSPSQGRHASLKSPSTPRVQRKPCSIYVCRDPLLVVLSWWSCPVLSRRLKPSHRVHPQGPYKSLQRLPTETTIAVCGRVLMAQHDLLLVQVRSAGSPIIDAGGKADGKEWHEVHEIRRSCRPTNPSADSHSPVALPNRSRCRSTSFSPSFASSRTRQTQDPRLVAGKH